MNKIILAVDPGDSGGFAWTDSCGNVHCAPMHETEGDVVVFLRNRFCTGIETVVCEQVQGFIGNKCPGSAMFNFGMGYGVIKGATQALGMKLKLVTPQKWQKALSLGNKKDWDRQWKNHLKETAQQLYPNCNVTLKTADALLILHYALNSI